VNVPTGQTRTFYDYAGSERIALESSWTPGATTLTFLFADHPGSTSLAVSEDGTVLGRMLYKPWGETRYAAGSLGTQYQFTGQRMDY
jgi:hypothetical protein